MDHVIPVSWGGKNEGNLRPAHKRCNQGKKNFFTGPMSGCRDCGERHWYEESCDPLIRDQQWDIGARAGSMRMTPRPWDWPELEHEPVYD